MVHNTLALHAPDQLRQRMAWALSQVFVIGVSGLGKEDQMEPWFAFYECAAAPLPANTEEPTPPSSAPHARSCTVLVCAAIAARRLSYACLDRNAALVCSVWLRSIFIRHAFGNMWDVLMEISFSPMMASYLTYLGSESLAKSMSAPDENYAREVMQLFSIGLWQVLSSC